MLVCTPEKTGSSRWKGLIYRSMGTPAAQPHLVEPHWLRQPPHEKAMMASDPSRVRLMFVRNPYARLLSGFLDMAVNPVGMLNPNNTKFPKGRSILSQGGPYSNTPAEFARFLGVMLDMEQSGKYINGHFTPLSHRCGIKQGLQYDFFLHVEEMDIWYTDVVALMGLGPYVANGWAPATKNRSEQQVEDESSCFYTLSGKSCAQTAVAIAEHANSTTRWERLDLSAPGTPEWMQKRNTGHARGADSKLAEYYATTEVIANATRYLQDDLRLFGYKPMQSHK